MYDLIEIYQLKNTNENRRVRFENLQTACITRGREPKSEDYDKVYKVGKSSLGICSIDPADILDKVYRIFNVNRPDDFKGHSLSISDIVTLDGEAWYVDTFGFKRLKDFFISKNYKVDKNGQLKMF